MTNKKVTYNGFEVDPETKNLKYFKAPIPMCCGVYTEAEIRKLKNTVNGAISQLSGIQQMGLQGEEVPDGYYELELEKLNEMVRSIVCALGAQNILKDEK